MSAGRSDKWGDFQNKKTMAELVHQFQRDRVAFPIPETPRKLGPAALQWASDVFEEETRELNDARTVEDQLDAILDLIYFALGRVAEMGVPPEVADQAFERIHEANMQKVRGVKSGRSDQRGFDMVKPPGWKPPDLKGLLAPYMDRPLPSNGIRVHRDGDPHEARRVFEPERQKVLPKIIVVGHGRHGKDTACEYLRDRFGFRFQSSSEFCAEHVVMPWMLMKGIEYASAKQCFEDRHNGDNRANWYRAITDYNTPDKSRLGRAILAENDIYNGLRNRAELWAMQATGIVDAVVWVDRTYHVPQEPASSMTIEPWMADYHVDNNGSMDELERNLFRLAERLIEDKNK